MRSLHDALPISDLLPAPAAEDCAVEQEVTEALQTRLRRGFVAPRRLGVRQAVDDGLPNRLGRITRARDVFPRRIDLGDLLLIGRSEEHTSELQSLMRSSYAVFCLKKKKYK